MMFRATICLALILGAHTVATAQPLGQQAPSKVDSIMNRMTLDEKIGQMNLLNGFWDVTGPVPAGGDAALKYQQLRNGQVGAMLSIKTARDARALQKIAVEQTRLGIPLLFGFDVIHGFKTIFPIPLGEAASWDIEAIEHSARISAIEASSAGIHWTFAPMVDVSRDARWGRTMEGAGEDPFLGSAVAVARVKGFQGQNLADHNTIAACAKHFAGYGFSEAGRDYNTVDIGRTTLFNVVLPPFKAASEAGVATFMNAFNIIDGVPSTGNGYLQRDVLKGMWNFKGFVVSDWASIAEMVPHGFAANGNEAAMAAAMAGSDMDMESHLYVTHLGQLVREGKVPESVVDDAVRRILTLKMQLGLLDDPYRYCDTIREARTLYAPEHREAALEMAQRSLVLLKNDQNLLPLPKSGKKIAVIGQLANDKNSPLGSWRIASDDHSAVSVWEGIQSYPGNVYKYSRGPLVFAEPTSFVTHVQVNETDESGIKEAVAVASKSDVAVVVLGEHGFQSGEGRSRSRIDFPGFQQKLLKEVCKVNKKVVLVVMSGRPLVLNWAHDHVQAIVQAWQPGSEGGQAIARVLYGDYNPSGKLPVSFPRHVGQVPLYYNHFNTGRPQGNSPSDVFWSHYIDEQNTPLYPFGYGLSYTRFQYSGLTAAVLEHNRVEVSVVLQNVGKVSGEEVIQLYIHDHAAAIARPVQELKGFQKVALLPGESKTLRFILTEKELGYFMGDGSFRCDKGLFTIMVGGDSKNVHSTQIEL